MRRNTVGLRCVAELILPRLNLLVIRSPDIERAIRFYEILGLALLKHAHGSGPEHYTAVAVDGSVFEIYPLLPGQRPTTDTRFGFAVDNVDDLVPALGKEGATVVVRPHDRDERRHAVVTDLDGHRV